MHSRLARIVWLAFRPLPRSRDAIDVFEMFLLATRGVGVGTIARALLGPSGWGMGHVALVLLVLVILFLGAAFRLQGDVDRRGEYDRVVRRLATFRLTLRSWRIERESTDKQYEFGKAHDAKDRTLDRYLERIFHADAAISKARDELHDYIRDEPLLGVTQLQTLMVVPIICDGRADIVAQGEAAEGWIADRILQLAEEQRGN